MHLCSPRAGEYRNVITFFIIYICFLDAFSPSLIGIHTTDDDNVDREKQPFAFKFRGESF